jgi:hypothetical protein
MSHDTALLTARLLADGYCVIPNAVAPAAIAALNQEFDARFAATPFCEGGFYGGRTKRFGALLRRAAGAEALVRHALVLDIADAVLRPWCDRIALNLTQAVEIHPGALAQYPHRDQDMWAAPKDGLEYLVNVMWPLTEFSSSNGATVLWPGSHRPGSEPSQGDMGVAMAMDPGEALLFLGSTLHGGGANLTDAPRRGIIVSYCLGWLKPFENQWLVYPPDIARGFDPDLAALVGYAQHRPNLGNVEGRCPSILFDGPLPDHVAAADALRPDQAAALDTYVADQEAARAGLIGS